MKNKVKLRMCGLLFKYDVRLSVNCISPNPI
nr:MAG TPA: hypothetical protein [Caudoviricetes sp.]